MEKIFLQGGFVSPPKPEGWLECPFKSGRNHLERRDSAWTCHRRASAKIAGVRRDASRFQAAAFQARRRGTRLGEGSFGGLSSDQRLAQPFVLRSASIAPVLSGFCASRRALPFGVPKMLEGEGLEVTLHAPGQPIDPRGQDAILYLFGEETLLTSSRIYLDWLRLSRHDVVKAVQRWWHDLPDAYDLLRLSVSALRCAARAGLRERLFDSWKVCSAQSWSACTVAPN
jgi:hypothetical protein